jgi:O-succinylbenzoate synthase
VETSIGLAAGLAAAAALPDLPYACGLGTALLLDGDVVGPDRAVRPAGGWLPVHPARPEPDPELLRRHAQPDPGRARWWRERLLRVLDLLVARNARPDEK